MQNTVAGQQMFNQASLDGAVDRLQELKLEEGKSAVISFIDSIPGMPNPPFVYCKVHWNSEMGENGRMFQCFGGSCCQQITWQKGWGGAPGKFDVNKARTRYYIPIIHYEQDPANPIEVKATIKYLNLTWSAYDVIVKVLKNVGQDVFFKKDAKIEAQKINGALIYQIYLTETQAQWQVKPNFKEQVDTQLPEVASKLLSAMPPVMTEADFLAIKPELDAKVQKAMASHGQNSGQSAQMEFSTPVGEFSPIPQNTLTQTNMMPQSAYTQPQVNLPVNSTPVQQTETQSIQEQQKEPEFKVPEVSLEFDPSSLLK